MKVGIITIVNVNNYGAELQSYALQKKICDIGHNAEVINYVFGISSEHDFTGEKLTIPLSWKTRIKRKLLPYIERTLDFLYRKDGILRLARFCEFHKKYNRLSSTKYKSVKSLYDNPMDYDIYCVGSDQVWNYQKGYSILPFLLDFIPEGKRRISFASSLGLSKLSFAAENVFKEHLSKFDALAVRETQTADLFRKLLNKKVDVVLDPTLLLTLEEWRRVALYEMCPVEKFLLLYIVTIKPCRFAIDLAERIAKDKGLKVVRIYRSAATYDSVPGMIDLPAAGPSDFVGLIDKADFVVTNSFHGTVFSLNFKKPFYTIVKKGKNTNSRLQSVLDKFGLTDRMISIGDSFPQESHYECCFDEIYTKLELSRKESVDILSQELSYND